MLIHTIVYAVLTLLSAVAVYAFSLPISKEPRQQQEASKGEQEVPEVEQDATPGR